MTPRLRWAFPLLSTVLLACPSSNSDGGSSSGASSSGDGTSGGDGTSSGGGGTSSGGASSGGMTSGGPVEPSDDPVGGTANPTEPAVKRGGQYGGTTEKFNRHYTDTAYAPAKTVYVSPTGNGNGAAANTPASVASGIANAAPGTRVVFQKGTYAGCFEPTKSGTADAPIVYYGERNPDGSPGAKINCCNSGRMSCFNFEATSYIAVDGFALQGGKYGIRIVGAGIKASEHSKGIAVLNNVIDGQTNDGVLTGTADWVVVENNVVTNSGAGDGHGVYLSNGSDYNIMRRNDLYGNKGATFQINADPLGTCDVTVVGDACDGKAGTGEGGAGASDFMLVEGNYFHHGGAQGSNFTSTRYSTVRNNVFSSWATHGVSFWSETADPGAGKDAYNPKLGSHHNRVYHNLFTATNNDFMLQFIANSGDNDVRNNLFVGMNTSGASVTARPGAVWMETDDTVKTNVYENNVYIAGIFDGRSGAGPTETTRQDLDANWFTKLPKGLPSTIGDFVPKAGAPFLAKVPKLASVPLDRNGKSRGAMAAAGPFELP